MADYEMELSNELSRATGQLFDELEKFFKQYPEQLEAMPENIQTAFRGAVKCQTAFYDFMTRDNQPSPQEFYGYELRDDEFIDN